MDIIGKLYKDYFINQLEFDGESHLLENFKYGGIGNILKEVKIFSDLNYKNKIRFLILKDNQINIEDEWDSIPKDQKIYISSESELPSALIFDKKISRTSFVINDKPIEISNFSPKSDKAIIFYGDKIILRNNIKYKQLFIDTAGNKYKDLFFDYRKISNNIIVSISEEYLTEELRLFYLNECNYKILSHQPKRSHYITKNNQVTVKNNYFKSTIKSSATGLGDKFFLFFSLIFSGMKHSPSSAIILSQKKISKLIKIV